MSKTGAHLRNLSVTNGTCTFDLYNSNVAFANAIRRSLMLDVKSVAPNEVTIHRNTSCQTDEFIAHRIGLIPFRVDETEDASSLKVSFDVENRPLRTSDFSGSCAAIVDVEVLTLIRDQSIKGEISFKKSDGSEHARFCPCAAAGYEVFDDHIAFRFESITNVHPTDLLKSALLSMRGHLEDVQKLTRRD